jgi:cytochrome c oxidase subunit II
MGAVFAIFAGVYYWFGKLVGITYDALLAKVHFWTFFVGVNLTFFPMHFLGMAGMPRRISDYPDSFATLNHLASLGSMVSVAATLLFFYIILDALLVQKRSAVKSTWSSESAVLSKDYFLTNTEMGIFLSVCFVIGVVAAGGVTRVVRYCCAPQNATDKLDVTTKLDAAVPNQLNFQTPATSIMEKIVDLHHDLMFFIIVIVVFVSWMLGRMLYFYNSENTATPRVAFAHHTVLEIIWTYIPATILILIAAPSFSLLYSIDALVSPKISVKVIGHQWYWSYETTDMITSKDINFDSYMLLEADLPKGALRLLEVDNRLVLPIRTNTRIIITAADVLHSWAIPALGVKMDAVPGRLNQVSLYLNRGGTFYGQCSELCGINHSFMPIVVDSVTLEQYRRWINKQS